MALDEDIDVSSVWIAGALTESGYKADFSPASIWELERFFVENWRDRAPVRGGLLADQIGSRMFAAGAYLGEVFRRNLGGYWSTDDSDPQGDINVELKLPDDLTIFPMQRVLSRLEGDENALPAYALVLGLDIGPQPEAFTSAPKRRRLFRRDGTIQGTQSMRGIGRRPG